MYDNVGRLALCLHRTTAWAPITNAFALVSTVVFGRLFGVCDSDLHIPKRL